MQVGSLGDTIFEVSAARIFTPAGVSFSREADFEDHKVQGDFPRPEFLAPGLMGASLAITLRADLGVDPYEEAEKLEYKMVEGEVMRLVIAGKNMGRFTIRKMDQNWRYALKSRPGPLAIDLSLELKEYF